MKQDTFLQMTAHELCTYSNAIQGEWDGDESGKKEERANLASDLFAAMAEAYALYKKLEGIDE